MCTTQLANSTTNTIAAFILNELLCDYEMDVMAQQELKQSSESKPQENAETESDSDDHNNQITLQKQTMIPFKEHKHGAQRNNNYVIFLFSSKSMDTC